MFFLIQESLLRNANLKLRNWWRAFRNPVSSCRGAKIRFEKHFNVIFWK